MSTKSLQQEVTNEIIKSLEEGTAPWHCPWVLPKSQRLLPHNIATGRYYSGINILMLWARMMQKRYTTNDWLTFNQAHKMHGHVIKGEKATRCFYYDLLEVKDGNSGETKLVPYTKCFLAFNLDQVSGGEFALPDVPKFDVNEKAEQLVKATGVMIEEGRKACYKPAEDFIVFPSKGVFDCSEDYYATLFHELVHWTSHESRLDRTIKSKKFGDDAYAFEELVAELGSAFLCAELGLVSSYKNHASYIDDWLKILKSDPTAIFKAASLASKAHKYIMPNTTEETVVPVNVGAASSNEVCNDTFGFSKKVSVAKS